MTRSPRTLDDDIQLIESTLVEVAMREAGPDVVSLAAILRRRCQETRERGDPAIAEEVRRLVESLNLEQASDVSRFFSFHFLLLNLAEDIDRVRRLRGTEAAGDPTT